MLRIAIPLVVALAACGGSSPPASGSGGSGGEGGGGACAGVAVRLGGDGHTFAPLHDGDSVDWERGTQGCCHVFTSILARGFADDDRVLYTFHVTSADGTDWSSGEGF